MLAAVLGVLALVSYGILGGGKSKALAGIVVFIVFLASVLCAIVGIVRLINSVIG